MSEDVIKRKLVLLGVVGKKGSGLLQDGKPWETDRVELHCLDNFSDDMPNAVGQTVIVYKIQDHDKHFHAAQDCIGQEIYIHLKFKISTKPGVAPTLEPVSFSPSSSPKKVSVKD